MTDRRETLKKSQKKLRSAMKESGKVQISDWINKDTVIKIDDLKQTLNFRRRGEVIDEAIENYYKDYMKAK